MNGWVIAIEAVVFAALFTTIVLTASRGDKKSPRHWQDF